MRSAIFLAAVIFSVLAVSVPAQDAKPSPSLTPAAPPKANARPAETPVPGAEPFDRADVKVMASKCVRLETEAGDIEMEFFPESAPESVRNFLNLTAIGAFDTTTFSRVVPG